MSVFIARNSPNPPSHKLAACMRFIHAMTKRGSRSPSSSICVNQLTQCKYRRKRERSKMLLRSGRRKPRTDGRVSLEIGIVLVWKRHLGSVLHFLLVLFQQSLVDSGGGRGKSWSSNKFLILLVEHKSIAESCLLTRVGLPTSLRANHKKGFSKL